MKLYQKLVKITIAENSAPDCYLWETDWKEEDAMRNYINSTGEVKELVKNYWPGNYIWKYHERYEEFESWDE